MNIPDLNHKNFTLKKTNFNLIDSEKVNTMGEYPLRAETFSLNDKN